MLWKGLCTDLGQYGFFSMFRDLSPCWPYPWNLWSRAPICLYPGLQGGTSTSCFWSGGLGLLLLSRLTVPEPSLSWRRLSMRTCCQNWAHAPQGMKFMCQRLLSRALHALRAWSPLCEGLCRETLPAAPSSDLEERPPVPWRHALLTTSKAACSSQPPSGP